MAPRRCVRWREPATPLRRRHDALLLGRAVVSLALVASAAGAQRVAPRETLQQSAPPVPSRAACVPLPTLAAPSAEQQRQAQEIAQRGQQAAILGDRAAARDQLRQASVLDPTNPDLAYQLARAEESTGSGTEAISAYCRFLALAPDAPEAADSRARLAQLMLSARQADSVRAASAFARGVQAYQNGQADRADAAFTDALTIAPDWAAAYYDRGLVRSELGRRGDAASDFQQYLRLEPGAPNSATLSSRIAGLHEAPLSPLRALALGLVIPGGGQFYAGRTFRGALTLAGAGIALACGLRQSVSTQSVERTATDPFGNPYTYTTTERVTGHPCRAPGFTAAGVIAIVSAIDAFRFAQR